MKKKICTCFLMTVIGLNSLYAQNWRLIKPAYPTKDAFVAGYSVTDFGAKGDGITDDTESFQKGLTARPMSVHRKLTAEYYSYQPENMMSSKEILIFPKG